MQSDQHSYLDGHRGLNDPLLMELGGPTSATAKKTRKVNHQSPMPSDSKGGFKIIGYGSNTLSTTNQQQLMMTTNKFTFKKVSIGFEPLL